MPSNTHGLAELEYLHEHTVDTKHSFLSSVLGTRLYTCGGVIAVMIAHDVCNAVLA